jgi:hypothetical protein
MAAEIGNRSFAAPAVREVVVVLPIGRFACSFRSVLTVEYLWKLMLAQTYDAKFLQSLQTVGVRADTDKARQFYQAAVAAGIEQAKERLRTLNSTERP